MLEASVLETAPGVVGGFSAGHQSGANSDARDSRSRSPDRSERAKKARENQVEIAKRLAKT